MMKSFFQGLAAFAALITLAMAPAHARAAEIYTGTFSSLAVGGYDVVAYFTDGRPVKGTAEFETQWKNATWRFASADHLAKFKAQPDAYAPQFGGYCAWAIAQNYTASGDPTVWKIVNGKLYLNYDRSVQQKWEQDIPGFIASANKNWPAALDH
jgi:YHS domain-containing protein